MTMSKWLMYVLLFTAITMAHAEEHDHAAWFNLVMRLKAQEHRLDKNDRRFIDYMINWIDVEEMVPTARQQRWLLDIERRLALGEKDDRRK
jgi:hypothetical protein